MIPNCAATRHVHFHLHGEGPAILEKPSLSDWPDVTWTPDTKKSKRVNLDTLTAEEVAGWKEGDILEWKDLGDGTWSLTKKKTRKKKSTKKDTNA